MRAHLLRLRGAMARGATPDLSDWLTTLEQMTVYEKYFTQDELDQLPIFSDPDARAEWQLLVEQGTGLVRSQVALNADAAKAFAQRWLDAFQRDTCRDDGFMSRMDLMAAREQQLMQEKFGISPELMAYVIASCAWAAASATTCWTGYAGQSGRRRMQTSSYTSPKQ